MRGDLDLFRLIEWGFLAGIDYDKTRSHTLRARIFPGEQHYFVSLLPTDRTPKGS